MIDLSKFSAYEPVEYLLTPAQKTNSPFLYVNKLITTVPGRPLLVILFGPGGVGKDSLARGILTSSSISKVRTATSRPRRESENESEDAYVWMRARKELESEQEYIEHLVVYGTPLASLRTALECGCALMLVTSDGVKRVMEQFHDEVNIVTVFIVPENLHQLYGRVSRRENPDQRMMISIDEIKHAPELAHYYVYNPVEFDGKSGLIQAQEALLWLIRRLTGKN
jgi:guanylate kinase